MQRKQQTPIRVGVIGVGRGESFANGANDLTGMKLVALCDQWKERVERSAKNYGVTAYTDFDKFLEHDMDAVILANYFHEHAPFAIKALEAGKHVMSECSSNATLAEGVALCRAVEKSKKIYMLAENYPYTKFNMEMRRLYGTGEIGRVMFAEGEYNHPMDIESNASISLGEKHWRNWIPSTYYCTHALAPLMMITDTMPISVNAHAIAGRDVTEADYAGKRNDPGSCILCRMDNGAVFHIFGLWCPGHSNWYRVHGTKGAMEVVRGHGYFGTEQVRVWHEEWHRGKGVPSERVYVPDWPEHGDLASRAGHGGGDFWTNFEFVNAIRTGKQPYLDVYRGVAMSSVGILAWKSALQNGAPFEMPDWKKESSRKKWENDQWSPFPSHANRQPNQPPPSILGMNEPSAANMARARKLWKKHGYKGK